MKQIKIWLITLLFSTAFSGFSQIKLPRLVSDGMILQRDTELNLWGWASPNEPVSLNFQDKDYKTTANAKGEWQIKLPPQPAGGPYEMSFTGKNNISLKDVLFGDLWIASGQSNMELTMDRVRDVYPEELRSAKNPEIRQFEVPDVYNFKEKERDLAGGEWKAVSPENISGFSAVGYFFAKELYKQYKVPVGLINAALGGSPVEAWMSEEVLKQFPEPYAELQKFKNDSVIKQIEANDQSRINKWYTELGQKDKGLAGNWKDPKIDDSDWKTMQIPGYWADGELGNINGVVWFRKEVDLPADFKQREASLWVGRLVDRDSVFVNGSFVGTTGYQYPPRKYPVKEGILKPGKNTIVVKLINESGRGGFVEDKDYFLAVNQDTINIEGAWKYKLGAEMPSIGSQTFVRWKPAGLYNSMIAPLENYPVKGVIWFQGESNTSMPEVYAERFGEMIRDWRKNLNQPDLPFLFVQLTNFMEPKKEPGDSNWARLRQAQLETLALPNTGMAVGIDLGEWNDIHPLNKKDVGDRLALLARKIAYGEDTLTATGPVPKSATREKEKVIIDFDHTGKGLVSNDGTPLKQFSLSDDGENFYWATAEIKDNKVIVSSEMVKDPLIVRYAWADNPDDANLYNRDGLPATPFELKIKK